MASSKLDMTEAEIEFMTELSRGPVADEELEAKGWGELAGHLQSRSMVQHDVVGQCVGITFVGRMYVPRGERG